jgi:PAS domain S-box-containing protein
VETEGKNIDKILAENAELKIQLEEANNILEAIREGAVDALVLNKGGNTNLYSLESADYTYRLLIEKIGEGAVSISDKGIILYCNDYFSKLINMPSEKIIGTFFNSYIETVGQFKELQDNLSSGLSKGEVVLNVNGKKIPVYVSLTDLQPSLPAIGIIITDLSENKQQQEALANSQKELEIKNQELNETNVNLEQFIHVISHDIKEPIRKIVTYASNLISTNAQNELERRETNLRIIKGAALRLNSLVDDLVKYAGSSEKQGGEEVDLNSIISEVSDDLEIIIQESKAAIGVSKLPVIKGSAVQMRQLFSNLFSNALKYRRQGTKPKIKVTTEIRDCVDLNFPNKKFHRISVSDNGIGMDVRHLERIFTIFQRLHMPNQYSGNGIGLAICKRIMENHYGKIDVESKLNEGSTFHLFFPVD